MSDKHISDAAPQQPAATSETVNVIGMPEFDGLLDHIYEHGTAAEGVIEKANAFARAVIARYAPQQPAAVDEAMVKRFLEAFQNTPGDEAIAADEVVFIDGVGAGRSSIKSCRDGVQWIVVGDRVYWPLSDSDAKRLQSACCGNGHFDGPATPTSEGEQK